MAQVAAIKLIKLMQEWVLDNCRKQWAYLRAGLEKLQREYPEIGDIRQAGLHIGVEMVKDPATKAPADDESNAIRKLAREKGVIFGKGGATSNLIKIKPPLIVKQEECDEILSVFSDVLRTVLRE